MFICNLTAQHFAWFFLKIFLRSRPCDNPIPLDGGSDCKGGDRVEGKEESCSKDQECSYNYDRDGGWSKVNPCVNGKRNLVCNDPAPRGDGAYCTGPATENCGILNK